MVGKMDQLTQECLHDFARGNITLLHCGSTAPEETHASFDSALQSVALGGGAVSLSGLSMSPTQAFAGQPVGLSFDQFFAGDSIDLGALMAPDAASPSPAAAGPVRKIDEFKKN
jgi:hypothetical protein